MKTPQNFTFITKTCMLKPAYHSLYRVYDSVHMYEKILLPSSLSFSFEDLLTQFLIRKLLCTFTGKKAWVSLATGAMCNLSEQLLLHSSFLGSRLHIFYKDNRIMGEILPCSTLHVKSFNGKDAFAIITGDLRENINCIIRLLPLSNSGLIT